MPRLGHATVAQWGEHWIHSQGVVKNNARQNYDNIGKFLFYLDQFGAYQGRFLFDSREYLCPFMFYSLTTVCEVSIFHSCLPEHIILHLDPDYCQTLVRLNV